MPHNGLGRLRLVSVVLGLTLGGWLVGCGPSGLEVLPPSEVAPPMEGSPPIDERLSAMTQMEVIPAHPTPKDDIAIKLSGGWEAPCVPMDPKVEMLDSEIRINTSVAADACILIAGQFAWTLMIPKGQLAAGQYHVNAIFSGPRLGRTARVIGGRDFIVGD